MGASEKVRGAVSLENTSWHGYEFESGFGTATVVGRPLEGEKPVEDS